MRAGPVLLVLLLMPLASAEVSVTDPEGDVRYEGTAPGEPPAQVHENVDILRAWIGNETPDGFQVGIETVAVNSTTDQGFLNPVEHLHVEFMFGGARHVVGFGSCSEDEALLSGSDTGTCLPVQYRGAARTVTVPKSLVIDRTGFAARAGTSLDSWFASSRDNSVGVGTGVVAVDRAPETGHGDPFSFIIQGGQFGDLVFDQSSYIRSSNGGPDTFVFPVGVFNHGPESRAAVSVHGVPPGWQVRVPASINLPSEDAVRVPVVVVTQSAHAHGSTEHMTLRVEPLDGPPAEATVGIHYLDVPQLAGHHNRLFVHASPSGGAPTDTQGWFNTLSEDPRASQRMIAGEGGSAAVGGPFYEVETRTRWLLPLDPSLLIGMDFDLARSGSFETAITAQVPATEAFLDVELWHVVPGDACGASRCLLAHGRSAPVALEAGQATPFEVELVPETYADLVPYVDGSNIEFRLQLIARGPPAADGAMPVMDRDATAASLPLNEFRDPVDEAFQQIGTLRMTTTQPYEKHINAGQRGWFVFDVHNDGHAAQSLRPDVIGWNSEWLTLQPAGRIFVPAEGSQRIAARIDVPADAAEGETLEAFLLLESVEDPSVMAMAKVRAFVTSQPVEEEMTPELGAPPDKRSPLPWLGALLLPLALHRRMRA